MQTSAIRGTQGSLGGIPTAKCLSNPVHRLFVWGKEPVVEAGVRQYEHRTTSQCTHRRGGGKHKITTRPVVSIGFQFNQFNWAGLGEHPTQSHGLGDCWSPNVHAEGAQGHPEQGEVAK